MLPKCTQTSVWFFTFLVGLAVLVSGGGKSDPILDQMKALSEETVVQVETKEGKRGAMLVPTPIFRYSDEPRRILDATLWAWIYDGRLMAFQKVEDVNHLKWTYCFASFAPEALDVTWPNGQRFQAAAPGVAMKELPGAPSPSPSAFGRIQQMKRMAERFSATIINTPDGSNTQEMRLLPKPVFVYPAKPAVPSVAIYGLTCNGTNPDAYVMFQIESREGGDVWRYGARRMTSGGVRVRLDDRPVWEVKWIQRDPDPTESWTFFHVERVPPPNGAKSPDLVE